MADKSYSIPSLLSTSSWQVTMTGYKSRWDDLFKLWKYPEGLLSRVPTLPRAIVLGQSELLSDAAGEFQVNLARDVTHRFRGVPANDLPLFAGWNAWQGVVGEHATCKTLSAGFFQRSAGDDYWLQLTPGVSGLTTDDDFPMLHAAALAPLNLNFGRFWKGEPIVFHHVLEDVADPALATKPWYSLQRTGVLQGQDMDHLIERYRPDLALEVMNLALGQIRGTVFGSRSFHGLVPTFQAVNADFDPLLLTRLDDRSQGATRAWRTRLLSLHLGAKAATRLLWADVDWYSEARDGLRPDAPTGFRLQGKLQPVANSSADSFSQVWGDTPGKTFQTFDAIRRTCEDGSGRAPPIVEFQLTDCVPVSQPAWLRLGSIEINLFDDDGHRLPAKTPGACTLAFALDGTIGSGATNVYPDTRLDQLPCRLRFAAGQDPVPETVSLDRQGGALGDLFETMRRETDPIVALDDQPARQGVLTMTTRYEAGRDAVTEIRVSDLADASGQPPGSAFWLSLRPFMVARVHFGEEQNLHATLVWRSDDPDGPQWRLEHDTVNLTLPPQAVAEEMERGNRFYDQADQPTIVSTKPVRTRFSRPAYLTLRSSEPSQSRRFNRSPLDLRELMRGALIDRMVVEMAYPLEATYERTPESTRRLSLVEDGEFLGKPAPALVRASPATDAGVDLPGRLRDYLRDGGASVQATYQTGVNRLVLRQQAIQLDFVSRLAELHVVDPTRSRYDLGLVEDIQFRLRDVEHGAPGLADPMPREAPLDLASVVPDSGFAKFLVGQDWSPDTPRAGLIHAFEMPSELIEVLDTPEAVDGVIEALCLSALGATGSMQASFAAGKTSFAVVVAHGQLSRLVKTRIGRVGALWNRAKHVIVYERTAAPSAQFVGEQASTQSFDGWPLLRKTQEYIEPIQPDRRFAEEKDSQPRSTGFIDASCFATRRIYVNGAWGRDLGDGYELPLWDQRASELEPLFYPKPQVCLSCHGEADRMTRLWFRDPDKLYFFSSSAPGTSADTDAWRPRLRVDYDNTPRWPVTETRDSQGVGTPADSGMCTSDRFDLAVDAEGPVDLQYGRGTTPMLVVLKRVSISRSSQASVDPELLDKKIPAELQRAVAGASACRSAATALAPRLDDLKRDLVDQIGKQLHGGNPCSEIAGGLNDAIAAAALDLKRRLAPVAVTGTLRDLVGRQPAMWKAAAAQWTDSLANRALLPGSVVVQRIQALCDDLQRLDKALGLGVAGNLDPALLQMRAFCVANVRALGTEMAQRIQAQSLAPVTSALAQLNTAAGAIRNAAQTVSAGTDAAAACKQANDQLLAAVAALDKLPKEALAIADPLRNWLRQVSAQVQSVAGAIAFIQQIAAQRLDTIRSAVQTLASSIAGLVEALSGWVDKQLGDAVKDAAAGLDAFDAAIEVRCVALVDAATIAEARVRVAELREDLQGIADAPKQYDDIVRNLGKAFDGAIGAASDLYTRAADDLLLRVTDAYDQVAAVIAALADDLQASLTGIVNDAAKTCEEMQRQLEGMLSDASAWAGQQAQAALDGVLSAETTRHLESYASQITDAVDVGSNALSLARAVGDLPAVLPLKFDIDVAAYVFDGVTPEIRMSPAVARLEQAGDKLLESLGMDVPCSRLLDQLVPDDLKGMNFSKVFRKFAGIDFKDLFRSFDLPELGSDKVKVTHGFDRGSRRAWVNSTVAFAAPKYQELFAFGPVALGLENMIFDAFTGVETTIVNNQPQPPVARTHSSIVADWILQGAGQMLVRFNEVAIKYDGASGFDFSVSPNNIELNPALKFVSEFIERFKGSLPPAIEIVEENGRPVGVSAGTTVLLDDLPDLGAVSIGPIDMRSSLRLFLDRGRFTIGSAFSLGAKKSPVWVQITWLGGGCWLEARADYVDGKVTPAVSVGLSVGSTKRFNFASVATGSYNVQLYCYIEITAAGDSVAIGLSIGGSALVVGFVNANIGLLLEAQHSGGGMKGTGRLDVEVKISWFFTFRFKQACTHQF